jgi:hypothetical protein
MDARVEPGHDEKREKGKTWMAGTSPAMTKEEIETER